MRSLPSPMRRLLLASMLVAALCSCSRPERLVVQSPPVADLLPSPEPQLSPDALNSAALLDQWDADVLAWGRTEHSKVARICQWFRNMGVKTLECTP